MLARVDLVASWIAAQIAAHPGSTAAAADAGGGDASAHDAGVADASAEAAHDAAPSAAPEAGVDAGDAGAAVATLEHEPNDTLAQANPLGATMSGAIGTSADVDWFKVTLPTGKSTLTLQASSDAVIATGVLSGTACPLAVTSAKGVVVSVGGQPAGVCVQVTSPGHKVQSYTLAVAATR